MLYLLKFQLTRSRGAWHREYQEKRIDRNNFNSHAHVERDFFILLACKPFCISTHTLTWSVTDLPPRKIRLRLFQLTRSRGAWRHERKKRHDTRYFNSHAHVERDFGVQVSLICMNYFNSHAHVERDLISSFVVKSEWNFNSHAHVERDHKVEWFERTCEHFNSHAHVERDEWFWFPCHYKMISTHTLTWSVTFL